MIDADWCLGNGSRVDKTSWKILSSSCLHHKLETGLKGLRQENATQTWASHSTDAQITSAAPPPVYQNLLLRQTFISRQHLWNNHVQGSTNKQKKIKPKTSNNRSAGFYPHEVSPNLDLNQRYWYSGQIQVHHIRWQDMQFHPLHTAGWNIGHYSIWVPRINILSNCWKIVSAIHTWTWVPLTWKLEIS